MKAAYIAYDKSSLETQKILSQYFEKLDYFILNLEQDVLNVDFDKIPVMADNYCIPSQTELVTKTHSSLQQKILPEFNLLKEEMVGLSKRKNVNFDELFKNDSGLICETNSYSLSIIKDIFFNSKKRQVFIEKDKVGVGEYQILFVENHQLIAQYLKLSAKNIFKAEPVNSHVWFTIQFEYELAKPREKELSPMHFFVVNDSDSQTVVDNWYFCQFNNNVMSIHQWVPYNQYKNSDYQKFLIERVEKNIRQKFDFIHFKNVNKCFVNSTPGFLKKDSVLKNKKTSLLMPAFNFWSQDKMNQYIYSKVDHKFKKMIKYEAALVAQNQQKGTK